MTARRERGQPNTTENTPSTPVNGINLSELKEKAISDLNGIARDLNVQNYGGLRKQELIFKILQAQAEKDGLIYAEGVLAFLPALGVPAHKYDGFAAMVAAAGVDVVVHEWRGLASSSLRAVVSRCARRKRRPMIRQLRNALPPCIPATRSCFLTSKTPPC